ncbi:MAG: chaperone modulator CbpM [Steroidobacteraceae bacterium]
MTSPRSIEAVLLDEDLTFTLVEISELCEVPETVVLEMVHEGVVDPIGPSPAEWRFHGEALTRARRAVRLVRDLELNWAGTALVLDLLDELERRSGAV